MLGSLSSEVPVPGFEGACQIPECVLFASKTPGFTAKWELTDCQSTN